MITDNESSNLERALHLLRDLHSRTTKGPWVIREHPGGDDDAFIEAPEPDGRSFGYSIEVFGDDRNCYDTWREDMEFAVAAHELLPIILDYIMEVRNG